MKLIPGTIIRLPSQNGGFNVWKVTAVHLGASNQEDLVSLVPLERKPGTAYGTDAPESLVPMEFLEQNPTLQILN